MTDDNAPRHMSVNELIQFITDHMQGDDPTEVAIGVERFEPRPHAETHNYFIEGISVARYSSGYVRFTIHIED